MVDLLQDFKQAVSKLTGSGISNLDRVGGGLGYRVDEKIPNWEKNSLKVLKLPRKTTADQVVKATERASELETQDKLMERLSKQYARQRAALVSIRRTRIEDSKDAISKSDELGFAEANYLKFLGMHNINAQQAEAEVRGSDRAHSRVNKILGD